MGVGGMKAIVRALLFFILIAYLSGILFFNALVTDVSHPERVVLMGVSLFILWAGFEVSDTVYMLEKRWERHR